MSKLLVRVPNWIGDCVMALPALRLLAEHGLDLRFVGKSWAPSLLHAFGGACEQLANGQKAGSQQLREIKADGFAQIMLMTHSCSSAAMAWRAGVRAIGYAKDWRGPLLHQRLAWAKEQHEVLRYWQLAEATLAWLEVPYNRPSLEDWQPPWCELTASEAQLAAGAAALQGAGLNEQDSISLICPVATGTVKGMDKQWPHFQAFASLWHDDAGTQGKTLAVVAPRKRKRDRRTIPPVTNAEQALHGCLHRRACTGAAGYRQRLWPHASGLRLGHQGTGTVWRGHHLSRANRGLVATSHPPHRRQALAQRSASPRNNSNDTSHTGAVKQMTVTANKKILFLTTPENDYLQDLLLSGFIQKLGRDKIIDLPFSKRIYFPRKTYPAVMIKRKRLATMRRLCSRFNIKDIGLVIVASCKPLAFNYYQKLLAQIPRDIPRVLIDGGDRRELGGDLDRLGAPELFAEVENTRPFDLIFKRELFQDDSYERPVLPLQLGFTADFQPAAQSPCYDVAFWCVESHPIRSQVLDRLQPHFDCVANGSVRGQNFRKYKRKGKRYLEELARCKIVVNFPGVGWDCQRYWEAPAVGAAMVSPRSPLVMPNDFKDGEHIMRCADDGHDIVEVCQRLLDDEPLRARIAKDGQQWALSHHSDLARAEAVLSGIESELGQVWR